MRFAEIGSGLRIYVNKEEQEFLNLLNEYTKIYIKDLSERENQIGDQLSRKSVVLKKNDENSEGPSYYTRNRNAEL